MDRSSFPRGSSSLLRVAFVILPILLLAQAGLNSYQARSLHPNGSSLLRASSATLLLPLLTLLGTQSAEAQQSTTVPPATSKPGVSPGNAQVTLTWTSNGNGGSAISKWQYRQKKGSGSYGSWTNMSGSGPSTTSHTVTGLANGTYYRFQVRAVNSIGDGTASPESNSVTPLGGVCTRTAQVRDAIVAKVWRKSNCQSITTSDLEAITSRLNVFSDKPLTTLKASDFDNLTNLTMLDLSGHSLTSLPVGVFNSLTSLTHLRLNNNSLSRLPARVFDNLTRLVYLNLNNNSLSRLPIGVFNNLTSLTHLDLGSNSLVSLPEGVFNKLTRLAYLELSFNNLGSLTDTIFDKLINLEQLFLSKNGLTSLPVGVFEKPTKLRWLYLSRNKLTSLPRGVFNKLTKLTKLSLWSNSLTCLPTIPNTVTDLKLDHPKSYYNNLCSEGNVTLTASSVEATTATLTIANHSGSWYYKYTAPSGGICSATAVTGLSKNLTSLIEGTSYTYKAYTDSSCVTELATAATFLTKPGQVTGVSLTAKSTALDVSWTAQSGTVTGYKVQWKSDAQRYDTTRQNIVTSSTTSSITNLSSSTTYTVRVTATNATGDGTPSSEVTGSPATTPPAPSKPTVSAGNAQVTLTWISGGDGGTAISKWQYARKTTGNYGSWTDICVTSNTSTCSSTTSHTVTGLTNGTAYTFKVRAVNSVGDGATSPESDTIKPGIVCGRTAQVRDAIVAAVSGKATCGDITTKDLAKIVSLSLSNKSVTILKTGDFDNLTSLTTLFMTNTGLSSLPAGVFDNLTSLTTLVLTGTSLSSLPAGVFDNLTGLTTLVLSSNSLSSLPAGVFDNLTSLTTLSLSSTSLSSLPMGVFDNLTSLTWLEVYSNSLNSLPAGMFDNLTSLTILVLKGNSLTCLPAIPVSVTSAKLTLNNARSSYAACGAGVTLSKNSLKVVPSRTPTYTVVLDAAPNGAAGNVTVTPTSSVTGTATVSGPLTFTASNWSTPQTVTVSSVAIGTATISHTVAGGGYGSATAASVAVDVSAVALAASAVTATTATLTIDGHTAAWYYKYTSPSGGSCSSAVAAGTSTANLTELSTATSYTYKAYSDSGCTTELATVTVLTKADKSTNATATMGAETPALGGGGQLAAASIEGNATATISSTPLAVTLIASEVEATTAMLRIGNYRGNWYYQFTSPSGGICSSAPMGGSTVELTNLRPGTSYTFAAYRDSRCASLLATAPGFLTKPGQVTGVTLVGLDKSLEVKWMAVTGASHYRLQWKSAAQQNYDPGNRQVIVTKGTTTRLTELDNALSYTVRVAAVNSTGPGAWSAEATGMPAHRRRFDSVILPEVIQNVSSSNMKAITSRLESATSGSDITAMFSVDKVAIAAIEFLQSHQQDLNNGEMEWKQALSGSGFSLSPLSSHQSAQADDAMGGDAMGAVHPFSTLVVWGSADFYSYDNKIESIDLNGDLFSAYIGVDMKPRADLLTGLAIAMNRSALDYTADDSKGIYTIKITSANPYVSWSPSDALSLWFSAAYGRGTVKREQEGEQTTTTDSSDWTSLSGGTRLQLWQSPGDGAVATSLELKLDGATAQFMETSVQQARLASSISRTFSFPSGDLTTAVELGVRMRSTEAAGLEVDGSLDWHNPAAGLSTTAHARVLLAGGDQREWGVSGRLNYAPGIDGKGLTIALQPSIGLTNSRLADLWSLENAELAVSPNAPEARLKGELGYGFPAWSGLMTPYSDFSIVEGGSHTIGMGLRYGSWSSELELDLRAEQETSTTGATDWSIGLEGRIDL